MLIKKYLIWIILISAVIVVYYFYNPAEDSFFLKCPFHQLTGYQCPGCGSQRAIHELLHFRFSRAFQYNQLLVLSVPYVLLGFIFNLKKIKEKYPKTRNFLFGARTIYFILGIIIFFGIFRNL